MPYQPTQTFVLNENPSRVSNRVYALAKYPMPGTQSIFVNGLLQNVSAVGDYVIVDNVITFNYDIETDDIVIANYIIETYSPPADIPSSASVSGRKELIHWCLRKLGAPVIDINLSDDQIEDRIDEALLYFRDYHFDGVERCYLHYQVTPSTMLLSAAYNGLFTAGMILKGRTSTAEAYTYDLKTNNTIIRYKSTNNLTFIPGEIVDVGDTGNTVTILNSSTAITIGNLDSGYIYLNSKVISVTNIIPQQSATIGGNLGGMFDFQYQFALNNMFNLASTDLVTYDIYKRYISMWEFMFRGQKGINFNKKTDRVYIDMQNISPDQWVVFEVWSALNPSTYPEIFMDEFVREYSYSLLKVQWGANLKKYSGISLPGGVTLNGQQIYEEGIQEIQTLRDRIRREFEFPPDFMVG